MTEQQVGLTVGGIIDGTKAKLTDNNQPVLTYLAIFIPLTSLANVLDDTLGFIEPSASEQFSYDANNGLIGIIVAVASIVMQYHLFSHLLGMDRSKLDAGFGRMAAFVGLAIVSFLGVGFATILLIVPGLILASRWLMCPSIYVQEGLGVFASLGQSWNRTRGNTANVIWSILLLILVFAVVAVVLGGIVGLLGFGLLAHFVDGILSELATVVLVAMSVAVYGLIGGRTDQITDVFE